MFLIRPKYHGSVNGTLSTMDSAKGMPRLITITVEPDADAEQVRQFVGELLLAAEAHGIHDTALDVPQL